MTKTVSARGALPACGTAIVLWSELDSKERVVLLHRPPLDENSLITVLMAEPPSLDLSTSIACLTSSLYIIPRILRILYKPISAC